MNGHQHGVDADLGPERPSCRCSRGRAGARAGWSRLQHREGVAAMPRLPGARCSPRSRVRSLSRRARSWCRTASRELALHGRGESRRFAATTRYQHWEPRSLSRSRSRIRASLPLWHRDCRETKNPSATWATRGCALATVQPTRRSIMETQSRIPMMIVAGTLLGKSVSRNGLPTSCRACGAPIAHRTVVRLPVSSIQGCRRPRKRSRWLRVSVVLPELLHWWKTGDCRRRARSRLRSDLHGAVR